MARQLRIDHPGAFYHIYSRGNQKQPVFLSDDDCHYFLKTLADVNKRFGVRFLAYCLMPNHYHLFAGMPAGGLSKAMHLVNTTYTIYFNKKHSRVGHLFQGRFKAILVEAETYAWELSRYIHLNPVRAGLVTLPEGYPWSSYREYLGVTKPRSWLDTVPILGSSRDIADETRRGYASFVLAGIGGHPPQGYDEAQHTGILGSSSFRDRIKAELLSGLTTLDDRDKPQLRYLRPHPEFAEILAMTKSELGPNNRFTKGMAIFISQHAMGYSLVEIGAFFGMSISGISNRRRRIQKELEHNEGLARAQEAVIKRLNEKAEHAGLLFSTESNDE